MIVSGDLQLPAGGTYKGQIACNREMTTYRDPRKSASEPYLEHGCPTVGREWARLELLCGERRRRMRADY